MKMAFYDNAEREMSCSGVLEVKRGIVTTAVANNNTPFDSLQLV
ncbi:hypothetical protein EYF80_063501 [Liparis tanakae]|uniref:Uncharacterized protein n=1 Tax=Liparis tanakae TaxID=230148 RepID=A0A4Z2EDJ9_9TELE|nr:hypothetical protein EYF80_063501 [Liparis tanakae]